MLILPNSNRDRNLVIDLLRNERNNRNRWDNAFRSPPIICSRSKAFTIYSQRLFRNDIVIGTVNSRYYEQFKNQGLFISGVLVDKNLAEIVEIPEHPWFIATQYHPEFKSRPHNPHPLFSSFINAALAHKK